MPKTAIIIIIAVIILVGLGYSAYWYFYQQKPVVYTQEGEKVAWLKIAPTPSIMFFHEGAFFSD